MFPAYVDLDRMLGAMLVGLDRRGVGKRELFYCPNEMTDESADTPCWSFFYSNVKASNLQNFLPAFSDFSFCSRNSSPCVVICLIRARNWAISSSFISNVSCICLFVSAITIPYRRDFNGKKMTPETQVRVSWTTPSQDIIRINWNHFTLLG